MYTKIMFTLLVLVFSPVAQADEYEQYLGYWSRADHMGLMHITREGGDYFIKREAFFSEEKDVLNRQQTYLLIDSTGREPKQVELKLSKKGTQLTMSSIVFLKMADQEAEKIKNELNKAIQEKIIKYRASPVDIGKLKAFYVKLMPLLPRIAPSKS